MLEFLQKYLSELSGVDTIEILLVAVVCLVAYKAIIKQVLLILYYRLQGVPFVFVNPFDFKPQWIRDRICELSQKYEKYFMYPLGPVFFLTLVDPEMIKDLLQRKIQHFEKSGPAKPVVRCMFRDGLAVAEGHMWKEQRKIMNKAFRNDNLIKMIPQIEEKTNTWVADIRNKISQGEDSFAEIDLNKAMVEFTSKGLVALVVGGHTDTKLDAKGFECVKWANQCFKTCFEYVSSPTTLLFPQKVHLNLDSKTCEFNQTTDMARKSILNVLSNRFEVLHQNPSFLDTEIDLLNLMIKGQCEGKNLPEALDDVNRDLIVDHLIAFFIAGVDTTATALTCLFFNMSKYPETLQKMKDEVEHVFGEAFKKDPTNFITNEGLAKLDYMTRALKENLRMRPPLPRLQGRRALRDVKIGDLNVKKGTLLTVDPGFVQNHHGLWKNAEEFDPDREELKNDNLDMRWIPFAAGRRSCIGQFFSMMESKVFLAKVLLQLDIRCEPDALDGLTFGFTVEFEDGVKAIVSDLTESA
mmetsp:Transcript_30066/g.34154  ORF Transcript_30066/g.34154 Transcript_30066/m.34154 type:complete len:524 (+) Transcript_30066:17-1588(+)